MNVGPQQQSVGNVICQFARIWMDVGGLEHVLNSASCYRAALAISSQKSRPESCLPSSNSNCADGALRLVTDAIWIRTEIIGVGATKHRHGPNDVGKPIV